MKEFIKDYPLFSYIAVPVIVITLIVLIVYILKPKSTVRNYYSRLYHGVLDAIDFIGIDKNTFKREHLRTLEKAILKIKYYYQMLESEELYEVEGIIANIDKALSITRALIFAKANEGEVYTYLMDIDKEFKEVRKVLFSFTLAKEEQGTNSFSRLEHIGSKKSKKCAEEYLKNLHQK